MVLFSFFCDHAHLELYVVKLPVLAGHLHFEDFEEQGFQNKVAVEDEARHGIAGEFFPAQFDCQVFLLERGLSFRQTNVL